MKKQLLISGKVQGVGFRHWLWIKATEKNIRGWKGDIPFYSYSTKKMNKMGYKFKLSSLSALKKTIKNISKKTLF